MQLKGAAGRASLTRLLLAHAAFDRKLGYAQGMAFVAALPLLMGAREEEAFWFLVVMLRDYNLRSFFWHEKSATGGGGGGGSTSNNSNSTTAEKSVDGLVQHLYCLDR